MQGKDIYVVNKIIGSRKKNGIKQYLVNWEGYPDSDNTWENEDNIFCKKLINEYEESLKRQKIQKGSLASKGSKIKKPTGNKGSSRTFSRIITNDWDDVVDKVVSVSKDEKNEGFMVQLLFKNGEMGVLPVSQAHIRCPLHLLEYYESNLIFTEDDNGENN